MPDDVYALRTLLLLLEGWQFYLAALPLVGIASLLIFNFSLRNWGSWLALAALLLLGVTLVYQPRNIIKPLDHYVGNVVWDQRSNYLQRGAMLYSLMEGARYFADRVPPPDREDVRAAHARLRAGLPPRRIPAGEFTPRNVHIILLESFWDPSPLQAGHYYARSFPEGFSVAVEADREQSHPVAGVRRLYRQRRVRGAMRLPGNAGCRQVRARSQE